MKMSLQIQGTNKVITDLKKFGRAGKRVAADVTQIHAFEIEAEAKRNAPVDTGKMRQAIKAEKFKLLAWTVTAFESYSVWVEFGTSKMSAQPFLYPAWRKQIKIYLKDLNTALQRVANKFNR